MRLRTWMATAVFAGGALAGPVAWAAGQAEEQPVVEQLLGALANTDYEAFVAQGTPEFAAIPRDRFSAVAAEVGPRLKEGYRLQRLGDLRQQGHDFGLWKVTPAQGDSEWLATLNLTPEGRVGGFFLR